MTAAIAEALIAVGLDATKEEIEDAVTANMQDWGKRYSHAGYGGRFRYWLSAQSPKPYNSYGNGSAMRVSAVGWLYPTLERTREVAVYTAEVTHNHPEGIKGAEATASCIFLASHGVNKDGIREYVIKEFGYDLNRTLDEIRPTYHHVESCQQTVPEAIIAFLESENFEDAVRNAVSLGGDTDTLAAITGSIAEAFYDMSAILRAECRNRVSEDILHVMQLFDEAIGRRVHNSDEYEDLSGNAAIETAIHQMYAKDDKNRFLFLLTMLCGRMKSKGHVLVPFVMVGEEMFSDLDVYHLKEGDTLTLDHDVRLHMDTSFWKICAINEGTFRIPIKGIYRKLARRLGGTVMERTIRVTGKGNLSVKPDTVRPEFRIEYTVAEPEKCKNELLANAVTDAKAKADVLSKASGVSLGEIITIDYSWVEIDFVSRPMDKLMLEECCMRSCEPDEAYDIDINPDDIDVTDNVTVVWEIK